MGVDDTKIVKIQLPKNYFMSNLALVTNADMSIYKQVHISAVTHLFEKGEKVLYFHYKLIPKTHDLRIGKRATPKTTWEQK